MKSKPNTSRKKHSPLKAFLMTMVLTVSLLAVIGVPSPVRGAVRGKSFSSYTNGKSGELLDLSKLLADLPEFLNLKEEGPAASAKISLQTKSLISQLAPYVNSLQSGKMVKNFSLPLDIKQLTKVIALQGTSETGRLLDELGLDPKLAEAVCERTSNSVSVARQLLRTANREPISGASLGLEKLYPNQPEEVRTEIFNSTLRALATSCLNRAINDAPAS